MFAPPPGETGCFLHSVPLLFIALGLFGVIAALFGPVKYAMLPDQLVVGELATGNALVEGATFMAILIGTIAGGSFVSGSRPYGMGFHLPSSRSRCSHGPSPPRIPATAPSAPQTSPITANPGLRRLAPPEVAL